MPWKESSVMDERLRFVARLLEGEPMSLLCREFGISRKTGYKIFDRYKDHGLEGLTDRSRRPVRYANQLPHQLETAIIRAKQDKPHWGARKIRELLVRRLAGDVRVPAKSTIHAVLDRHGLVKPAIHRRHATGTALSLGQAPNELWVRRPAPLRHDRGFRMPAQPTTSCARSQVTRPAMSWQCTSDRRRNRLATRSPNACATEPKRTFCQNDQSECCQNDRSLFRPKSLISLW